jgi:hypothetical protein
VTGVRDGFIPAPRDGRVFKAIAPSQDVWDTITLRIVNCGRMSAYIPELAWVVGRIDPVKHRTTGDPAVRAGLPIELRDGNELAIPFARSL